MSQAEVIKFIVAALESSIYHAPLDPGLSIEEIFEACHRVEFQDGEINDALPSVITTYFGSNPKRFLPNDNHTPLWGIYAIQRNPEFRSIKAADFVYGQLHESARAFGAGAAKIERNVLAERGVGHGLKRLEVEATVTLLIICGQLVERDNFIAFKTPAMNFQLPSQHLSTHGAERVDETRRRAYTIVGDLVERRNDGRAARAEPLSAFADALSQLGYGMFRTWWIQTVSEMKVSDEQASPLSMTVISAALVEGALAFCVRHSRLLGLSAFQSSEFAGEPQRWKIEKLVSSAASGGEGAILDPPARQRADRLILARQRIHVGRLLAESPRGVPDLRPDEARDAKATAELVVRNILDWLEKHPAPGNVP